MLLSGRPLVPATIDRMFLASRPAGLGGVGLGRLGHGGRGSTAPPRRHPSLWGVLRRYHPGRVLLMGMAMGFGLGLADTRSCGPFAADLQIPRIAVFFAVYAATAIITRVLARRLPEWLGLRPVVVMAWAC